MKFTKTAIAAASLGVATALSLTAAGAATAAPAGQPKHHSKPTYPQVNGNKLRGALLPASAFGDGFASVLTQSTGGSLRSSAAKLKPGGLSCKDFEQVSIIGAWGDTAGAQDSVLNLNVDISAYPSLVLDGGQNVLQFANPKAAAAFFGQDYAKYGACESVTLQVPEQLGGGTEDLVNQSLAKTTIGKYQAFNLVQTDVQSDFAYNTWYRSLVVVLAGTNVYTVYESDGTNDPVSADLITKLVKRVQALYPRH